jgi:hypothetical protein
MTAQSCKEIQLVHQVLCLVDNDIVFTVDAEGFSVGNESNSLEAVQHFEQLAQACFAKSRWALHPDHSVSKRNQLFAEGHKRQCSAEVHTLAVGKALPFVQEYGAPHWKGVSEGRAGAMRQVERR